MVDSYYHVPGTEPREALSGLISDLERHLRTLRGRPAAETQAIRDLRDTLEDIAENIPTIDGDEMEQYKKERDSLEKIMAQAGEIGIDYDDAPGVVGALYALEKIDKLIDPHGGLSRSEVVAEIETRSARGSVVGDIVRYWDDHAVPESITITIDADAGQTAFLRQIAEALGAV